jgi:uncharacterized protein
MKHRPVAAQRPLPRLRTKTGVPEDLAAFVGSDLFPCVGAKSALARSRLTVFEAGTFLDPRSNGDLHRGLMRFGAGLSDDENGVASFACLFDAAPILSEQDFEAALWQRLQGLHDIDAERGFEWAEGVGKEPGAHDFSFSIGGVAYFVVGLHPGASRAARRFCRAALVFNAHEQFEQLRRVPLREDAADYSRTRDST